MTDEFFKRPYDLNPDVTAEDWRLFLQMRQNSRSDLERWDRALAEYRRQYPGGYPRIPILNQIYDEMGDG